MRKIITILITIGVIFGLAACGTNNDTNSAKSNEIKDNVEVTKDEENKREIDSEETESKESDQSNDGDNINSSNENSDSETESNTEENSEIREFEESEVIEEEVDVSDLNVEIETDNDNNRVILFKENNKPVYKTVYIKRDQRLKIIDIKNNEGQIYNEIIES